jgi:NADH-quinone oxidoreductase subunit G
MVKIIIDDQELEASSGDMIIEVADDAGIYIPRFCYHKKLSIAANCRMCMVQIANSNKTIPACATPVVDGMQIYTKSKHAINSQRAVMEFLLINHPLDCPICDQGGECELQDLSVGYGKDTSIFNEVKRVVSDHDIGPLITTNMTRCIHCTRCIRFGKEIAGVQDFGLVNRGDKTEVRTYIGAAVKSNLSGNLIDICPVGALNSKPYAYQARSWELKNIASIAPHDCLGANIDIHTREKKIFRVVARENDNINETWISDRDRFSYLGVQHSERLKSPCFKRNGRWHKVSWQEAIEFVSKQLKSTIKNYGAEQLAGIISPSSTLEELFLFQNLIRGLGSNNVDHRIHEQDFTDQKYCPIVPTSNLSLDDLEKSDRLLIFAANIDVEQPLLTVKIRNAIRNGAEVYVINPIDHEFNFEVSSKVIISNSMLPNILSQLIELSLDDQALTNLDSKSGSDSEIKTILQGLSTGSKLSFITGSYLYQHSNASLLRTLIEKFQSLWKAQVMNLIFGANGVGAWLSGCVPHRKEFGKTVNTPGLNVIDSFKSNLQTYCIYGIEPEVDCLFPGSVLNALNEASSVIVFSPYVTEAMRSYAGAILPISTFAEMSGCFINMFGNKQEINNAISPMYNSKPGQEVLLQLSEILQLPGLQSYELVNVGGKLDTVLDKMEAPNTSNRNFDELTISDNSDELSLLFDWQINAIDPIVRRSYALQEVSKIYDAQVYVSTNEAEKFSLADGDTIILQQGSNKINMLVGINHRLPRNTLYIPLGVNNISYVIQGKIDIIKC